MATIARCLAPPDKGRSKSTNSGIRIFKNGRKTRAITRSRKQTSLQSDPGNRRRKNAIGPMRHRRNVDRVPRLVLDDAIGGRESRGGPGLGIRGIDITLDHDVRLGRHQQIDAPAGHRIQGLLAQQSGKPQRIDRRRHGGRSGQVHRRIAADHNGHGHSRLPAGVFPEKRNRAGNVRPGGDQPIAAGDLHVALQEDLGMRVGLGGKDRCRRNCRRLDFHAGLQAGKFFQMNVAAQADDLLASAGLHAIGGKTCRRRRFGSRSGAVPASLRRRWNSAGDRRGRSLPRSSRRPRPGRFATRVPRRFVSSGMSCPLTLRKSNAGPACRATRRVISATSRQGSTSASTGANSPARPSSSRKSANVRCGMGNIVKAQREERKATAECPDQCAISKHPDHDVRGKSLTVSRIRGCDARRPRRCAGTPSNESSDLAQFLGSLPSPVNLNGHLRAQAPP